MHGLWGMGQMMFSKYIIAVDEDCDVHNTSEVLFRLCANTDPGRDTTIIKNPSDSLDHAPSEQNIGSHMGFDATRKLPGENYHRPWPELLNMTDEARALVDKLQAQARWKHSMRRGAASLLWPAEKATRINVASESTGRHAA
jgi:4-hydroxy-3-polyprenylbenzoate decarboxylase